MKPGSLWRRGVSGTIGPNKEGVHRNWSDCCLCNPTFFTTCSSTSSRIKSLSTLRLYGSYFECLLQQKSWCKVLTLPISILGVRLSAGVAIASSSSRAIAPSSSSRAIVSAGLKHGSTMAAVWGPLESGSAWTVTHEESSTTTPLSLQILGDYVLAYCNRSKKDALKICCVSKDCTNASP